MIQFTHAGVADAFDAPRHEAAPIALSDDARVGLPDATIQRGAEATLGAIFRTFGGAYLQEHAATSSNEQLRVLQLMALCRTAALGTAHWECETCGHVRDIHNPCRDRHCGSCGEHLARQWYDAHSGELLPLAHQHVVFTAAHELHVLLDVWENRRVIYPLYLRAARDALVRVAGEMLGIMPGQAAFLDSDGGTKGAGLFGFEHGGK